MNFIANLKDKITQYIDVNIKLLKLSIIDTTSSVLSYFIFIFIVLFLVMLMFIFMGFGLAEWFTLLFNSRVAGFFTTFGVFVLIFSMFLALRKNIIRFFSDGFIKVMTERSGKDEENEL